MAEAGVYHLRDVKVPKPNKGLAQILMSPNMEMLMLLVGTDVVARYRAKVAVKSGKLKASAEAGAAVGGKKHDRWTGKVTIGGEMAVAAEPWRNPRNTNPGQLFYYGVLHEHGDGGNPPSGWDFPAAKDLRAVVASMSAGGGIW